jgi:hypothetical protein
MQTGINITMFLIHKYVLLVTMRTPISAHIYFNNYQRKWEHWKIVNETTVVHSAKWWEILTDEVEGFSKW